MSTTETTHDPLGGAQDHRGLRAVARVENAVSAVRAALVSPRAELDTGEAWALLLDAVNVLAGELGHPAPGRAQAQVAELLPFACAALLNEEFAWQTDSGAWTTEENPRIWSYTMRLRASIRRGDCGRVPDETDAERIRAHAAPRVPA